MSRKVLFLFLVFLVGCAVMPTKSPFVYNEECSHVCWMNINPDVTTMDEARAWVDASSNIRYIEPGNDAAFELEWRTRQIGQKAADVDVSIIGKNGIVSEVTFNFPAYISLEHFIDLLGEPDEISVIKQETAEVTYVEYVLYYTQEKVLIASNTRGLTGPDITDPLGIVWTNFDINANDLPNWLIEQVTLRQPWQGFEKMDEYLLYR